MTIWLSLVILALAGALAYALITKALTGGGITVRMDVAMGVLGIAGLLLTAMSAISLLG